MSFAFLSLALSRQANKQPPTAIEGAGLSKVAPLYLSCLSIFVQIMAIDGINIRFVYFCLKLTNFDMYCQILTKDAYFCRFNGRKIALVVRSAPWKSKGLKTS
ncbi:MAG: hypothetical protein K2O64_00200 [Lactobacillus sp.]|nr:hypothetical protein [Lactobacillus sp.]